MIHTGTYPQQLKIAEVTPIFKANDKEQFSNYRPISLLPSIISKLFESVTYQQLMKYLLENELLSSQQYSFRANHSTELTALNLIDRLTYDLDNGKILTNIISICQRHTIQLLTSKKIVRFINNDYRYSTGIYLRTFAIFNLY